MSTNTGKYGPEKTPYLDIFHAVTGSYKKKSVLMNIDLFIRNVNIKRLDVALPGDKLSL